MFSVVFLMCLSVTSCDAALIDLVKIEGHSTSCPAGFHKIAHKGNLDGNFNQGNSGLYIYLCGKWNAYDQPITDLTVVAKTSPGTECGYLSGSWKPIQYVRAGNGDFSHGAHGKYIYLCYRKRPGAAVIVDLEMTENTCDAGMIKISTGMDSNGRFNQGSDGKSIYLCERKQALDQAPTPAPATTAAPTNNLFHVESGSCRVVDGGTCYQSTNYPRNYPDNDQCRARATRDEYVHAVKFQTESGFDHLYIEGHSYTGTSGPNHVYVSHNALIRWQSDYSGHNGDWKICASPATTTATTTKRVPTPAPRPAGDSIRLRDGNTCRGRVEIYQYGYWGTVCDDDWDNLDAVVACKQLGFTGDENNARRFKDLGPGSGPILFIDFECTGIELTLDACPGRWGPESDCRNFKHAGVDCCEVPASAPTPAPTPIHMDVQTILLSLIYIMLSVSLVAQLWTIFVEHTWCCGGNGGFPAILLSLVDPTQDSENIWGRTPAASKISALACPGWAVATLILWIGMPWEYYRGCEMIICRAIALSCVIHQIWWWRACFGKVDVNDIYQRDASVYLVRTSIPDFILGGSAAYVGFLSGPWSDEGFIDFYIMDWVRLVILFFLVVCACFACVYSAFYSQELIVKDAPHGSNDPPPATLWNMTPAGSKICAIRASAWTMSFFATGICVVWTMNRFLICKFYQCMSVAYVWFQFLYYFGMLGHTDDALFRGHLGTYASSHVRRWNDFFKWQTFPGDVIFFIMFTVLGWLSF